MKATIEANKFQESKFVLRAFHRQPEFDPFAADASHWDEHGSDDNEGSSRVEEDGDRRSKRAVREGDEEEEEEEPLWLSIIHNIVMIIIEILL